MSSKYAKVEFFISLIRYIKKPIIGENRSKKNITQKLFTIFERLNIALDVFR